MNIGVLSATALLLLTPAQEGPPSLNPTYPLRATFVTAAETVIDDADAVDLKADEAHFSGQIQQVNEAETNLTNMAGDDRETDIAAAMKDLIFQVNSCHIQAIDGTDTSKCEAQLKSARDRAMESLNRHKVNGAWVKGPPA